MVGHRLPLVIEWGEGGHNSAPQSAAGAPNVMDVIPAGHVEELMLLASSVWGRCHG